MNTITTKDGTQIYYKDWGNTSAMRASKIIKGSTLKVYPGFSARHVLDQ